MAEDKFAYIKRVSKQFSADLNLSYQIDSVSIHGDKCLGYRAAWSNAGIPFQQGVLIYLLTYTPEFCQQVRETGNGWVDPGEWVVEQYRDKSSKVHQALQLIPAPL